MDRFVNGNWAALIAGEARGSRLDGFLYWDRSAVMLSADCAMRACARLLPRRSRRYGTNRVCNMRVLNVVILAVLSAFWIFGLLDQLHSLHAVFLYLALSLVVVAIEVWRWLPQRKLKPLKPRDPHDPRQ